MMDWSHFAGKVKQRIQKFSNLKKTFLFKKEKIRFLWENTVLLHAKGGVKLLFFS